jgi:ubiquinone/menaquinone biosynthesis C-methylase UbiE
LRRLLGWFLALFFKLLYHQMAWTYDWVAAIVSLGMWQNWVRTVIPFLKEGKILELGHGPGHLQAELLQKGLPVTGVDLSPQMSHLAARRLQKKGYQPSLVRGKAQALPFMNGTFNKVVATFPSEYIMDPLTLTEIERVLAPGGQLIILALAWITGKRWMEKAAAWLFRITGEAPEWEDRFLDPVRKAGFQAQVEWVELKSSRLVIILATKAA